MRNTDKIIKISTQKVYPGLTLRENLDYLEMKVVDLAGRTDLTQKHIIDILEGRARITPLTAIKFEKVLGIKASFWNNLEANYQLRLSKEKQIENLEPEVELFEGSELKETYAELRALKLIKDIRVTDKNIPEIIFSLQKYWGLDSLTLIHKREAVAFRRYEREKVNKYTVSALIRAVELHALNTYTPEFNKSILRKNIEKIRKNTKKSFIHQIEETTNLLAEAGVVLVCIPKFKNTFVQGVTKWVSKDKVAIAIKTTNQSEDKFWFNLFHELGHVLFSKKETYVDLENIKENSEEEVVADNFANKTLMKSFSKKELMSLVDKKDYLDLNPVIEELSNKYDVSPSIVAGRISYEFSRDKRVYPLLNKFIKRIDYSNLISFSN